MDKVRDELFEKFSEEIFLKSSARKLDNREFNGGFWRNNGYDWRGTG